MAPPSVFCLPSSVLPAVRYALPHARQACLLAAEVLRTGRVSWRLRDDDNLLRSRVESQLTRAVALALDRLRAAGRLRQEPQLRDKDLVTVDGHLGIVTVGPPEFDLELA